MPYLPVFFFLYNSIVDFANKYYFISFSGYSSSSTRSSIRLGTCENRNCKYMYIMHVILSFFHCTFHGIYGIYIYYIYIYVFQHYYTSVKNDLMMYH